MACEIVAGEEGTGGKEGGKEKREKRERGGGQKKKKEGEGGGGGGERDASELVCRNWQADAQDRCRWRHLLESPRPTQGCRAAAVDDDDD